MQLRAAGSALAPRAARLKCPLAWVQALALRPAADDRDGEGKAQLGRLAGRAEAVRVGLRERMVAAGTETGGGAAASGS